MDGSDFGGSHARLSAADVERLMTNPVAEIRARTATKLTSQIAAAPLSGAEREVAHEILRALAGDAALIVREALSEGLCRSDDVPRDVAMALARDVETVALPVLEFSAAFTDLDLIELIAEASEAKHLAVARRKTVSEAVSNALIDTGSGPVARTLLENAGAAVSQAGFGRVLDLHGDDKAVTSAMAGRASLPVAAAERLVTLVSEQLRHHLLEHHELPAKIVCELVLESRERALAGLIEGRDDRAEAARLTRALYGRGHLTHGLVLRVLFRGDIRFFEQALAEMALVPPANATLLLYDEGELGLEAICRRAGFAPDMIAAIRQAIGLVREEFGGEWPENRARFRDRLAKRLAAQDPSLEDLDPDQLAGKLWEAVPAF